MGDVGFISYFLSLLSLLEICISILKFAEMWSQVELIGQIEMLHDRRAFIYDAGRGAAVYADIAESGWGTLESAAAQRARG